MSDSHFCIFPAFGYWEINSRPVSSAEAKSGLHPDVVWVRIGHSECCGYFLEDTDT